MYKYVAAIAAFFAFMGLAYYEGMQHAVKPAVTVQQTTRDVEHVKTTTQTQKKITKEITKKDGTVEKTTVEETQNVKVLKKDDDKTNTTVVQQPAFKTKYSLGLEYLPSLTTAPSFKDLEVNVGVHLGDLNAWLETGFNLKDDRFLIGFRYEW